REGRGALHRKHGSADAGRNVAAHPPQLVSTTPLPRRIAGIDVGGTFTDLIVVDDDGDVRIAKVPTTTDNQAFGVLAAIAAAGAGAGAADGAVPWRPTPT